MAIGNKTIQLLAEKLNDTTSNTNWGVNENDLGGGGKDGLFLILLAENGQVVGSTTALPSDAFSASTSDATEVALTLNSITYTETTSVAEGTPKTFKIVSGKTMANPTSIMQQDTISRNKYIVDTSNYEVLFEGSISGGASLGTGSQFALTNIKIVFS